MGIIISECNDFCIKSILPEFYDENSASGLGIQPIPKNRGISLINKMVLLESGGEGCFLKPADIVMRCINRKSEDRIRSTHHILLIGS
jgi:hypothetical protein